MTRVPTKRQARDELRPTEDQEHRARCVGAQCLALRPRLVERGMTAALRNGVGFQRRLARGIGVQAHVGRCLWACWLAVPHDRPWCSDLVAGGHDHSRSGRRVRRCSTSCWGAMDCAGALRETGECDAACLHPARCVAIESVLTSPTSANRQLGKGGLPAGRNLERCTLPCSTVRPVLV